MEYYVKKGYLKQPHSKDSLNEPSGASLSINQPSRVYFDPCAIETSQRFQSIGTFAPNSDYDYSSTANSRCNNQASTNYVQQSNSNHTVANNNNKLQEELNKIDQLKRNYQTRIHERAERNRINTVMYRSSEKNNNSDHTGRSLSNEKHHLKPSNTPHFVKRLASGDSAPKAFRGEESNAKSVSMVESNFKEQSLKQFYLKAKVSNSRRQEEEEQQQAEESQHLKSDMDQNDQEDTHESNRQRIMLTRNLEQRRAINSAHETCMEAGKVEMLLRNKQEQLEAKYRKEIEEGRDRQHNLQQRLSHLQQQSDELRRNLEKESTEKQQLQRLLKQVLFERQRQKILRQKGRASMKHLNEKPMAKSSVPTPSSNSEHQPKRVTIFAGEQNVDYHNIIDQKPSAVAYTSNGKPPRQPLAKQQQLQQQQMGSNIYLKNHHNREHQQKSNKDQYSFELKLPEHMGSNVWKKNKEVHKTVPDSYSGMSDEEKKQKVQNILDKLKIKISRY